MDRRQRAANAALSYVESNMTVGLGTGSTADRFIDLLADAIQSGKLRNIRGVATSTRTHERAEQLGIPLLPLAQSPGPDVTIDGADEISPTLDLIKGLGGALLREKIVAQNSRRLIIIADADKRVARLGTRSPLPVEVTPFAHQVHKAFFKSLGCEPELRADSDGKPFITDNGNVIYDCHFAAGIADPPKLEMVLKSRAGIVETGLFVNMAHVVLLADDNDLITLTR